MINLLIGPSGGGKSYEANVFHVLPALQQGRKVITNLPVNFDFYCALETRTRELLEVRTKALNGSGHPFSTVDEFGDDWRHPEKGYGALYVIDECHKMFPRVGTPRSVAEWFAEHRHELCDVLLITQSYGKLDPDIRGNIQVLYKVKKATAFGEPNYYYRKVIDGIGGGELDVQKRTYEPKYFKLYNSHTRSLAHGEEQDAKDIRPRFKTIYRLAAAVFVLTFLVFIFAGKQVISNNTPALQSVKAASEHDARRNEHVAHSTAAPQTASAVASVAPPAAKPEIKKEPFDGMGIHIVGSYTINGVTRYLVALAINGNPLRTVDTDEIARAGYSVTPVSDCVIRLQYQDNPAFYSRCDLPQQTIFPKNPQNRTGV